MSSQLDDRLADRAVMLIALITGFIVSVLINTLKKKKSDRK